MPTLQDIGKHTCKATGHFWKPEEQTNTNTYPGWRCWVCNGTGYGVHLGTKPKRYSQARYD